MDSNEFRIRGKEMIDYIADYMENIKERRVTPDVEPGYLSELLPKEAPEKGENWQLIISDFEDKIMPGITHWQHPRFHAYFPAGNCYPSILGELMSAGLGTVGFSWAASPSCTELETIVLNWLGQMLNLPKMFLPMSQDIAPLAEADPTGPELAVEEIEDDVLIEAQAIDQVVGGGVILGSASECVLVALLSARGDILRKLKAQHPFVEDGVLLSKLIMYTSKLAHSCVEKAAMIAMVKVRLLETDEKFSLRGIIVEKQLKEDRSNGLIPFFVSCTFGTTSCCSFDNLSEIGALCTRESIYLHVDGAYAGSSLICPEFRPLVKNKFTLTKALSVDPIYLRYKEMDKAIDYRHWGIALSRRFRALKIWFTLRSYGIQGLQNYIREHVRLAKKFEHYVLSDARFEILGRVQMGLVCFRLKGANSMSQQLLFVLNDEGKIHMVPAMLDDKYVIRFCVNAANASDEDMFAAWDLVRNAADSIQPVLFSTTTSTFKNSRNFNESFKNSISICGKDSTKSLNTKSDCFGSSDSGQFNSAHEDVTEPASLIQNCDHNTRIKRLHFGISKMVSEPEFIGTKNHTSPKNQYKRTNTFGFNAAASTSLCSMSSSSMRRKGYLARKCSMIEKEDDFEEVH